MGFLGLFKSGKKAGDFASAKPMRSGGFAASVSAEPEFLKKIDLSAPMQDQAPAAVISAGSPDAPVVADEVEPELALWLSNGLIARNLKELAVALKKMSAKEYKEYADSQKNEIAEWIREILNDERLARQLKKAKNKIQATKLVEKASNRTHRQAKPTATTTAKAPQKAGKAGNAGEKRKTRSSSVINAMKEAHRGELELPRLPELPPMPKEVEKSTLTETAKAEMPAGKPKPRLSLWPFSKKKEPEQEQQAAPERLTETGEISLPLPEIPELPEQQVSSRAKIPARKKVSGKQKPKAIAEALQRFPTAQNEKTSLEAEAAKPQLPIDFAEAESLPEFPEEGDLPSENLEISQLAKSQELPAIRNPGHGKLLGIFNRSLDKDAAKPALRISFADAEKPKRFLFFGMKSKPKEEKPADNLINYDSIPELGAERATQANKPDAETPKKQMFGTYLKKTVRNAGYLPEAAEPEKAEEAFEPEPQHTKWEDSSVIEELPAAEEEKKIEKLQATKAEKSNKAVITGVDEQDQLKPDIPEHSQLDRQAKELEKTEQMLNRDEEELNTRRLELTRRRYEIIKQKGELEKRRFEEFMEQHKLAPQDNEIVHEASPEHVITAFKEPEQTAAQLKGMPDFRLAGAYGKERLEELLEQAKENISGNNIQAAKKALDEVQAVFNTVYMTTSEKKNMEYEILEVEADLKLASLK